MKRETAIAIETTNEFFIMLLKFIFFFSIFSLIIYLGLEVHWTFFLLMIPILYLLIFLVNKFMGWGQV